MRPGVRAILSSGYDEIELAERFAGAKVVVVGDGDVGRAGRDRHGPAIGGGVYLATACDLVVAVDTAYFQMGEIHAGNHSGGAFVGNKEKVAAELEACGSDAAGRHWGTNKVERAILPDCHNRDVVTCRVDRIEKPILSIGHKRSL